MADFYDELSDDLMAFVRAQPVFFVASAARGSRVNLSPKGMDTLRVLDRRTLAYLDLTGSGNETASHIAAGGRVTLMCCSFDRRPRILRVYARGEVVALDSEWGRELRGQFPDEPGVRQVIVLHAETVQTSCGYAVPRMELVEERDTWRRWAASYGEERLREARKERNAVSMDGLPAPGFSSA